MPIYEYQCQACQHQLEVLQKINEAPMTTCPECQADQLQKMISATSFQLKGTGWYVTDFKNKNTAEKKATDTGNKELASSSSTDTTSTTTSTTEAKKT